MSSSRWCLRRGIALKFPSLFHFLIDDLLTSSGRVREWERSGISERIRIRAASRLLLSFAPSPLPSLAKQWEHLSYLLARFLLSHGGKYYVVLCSSSSFFSHILRMRQIFLLVGNARMISYGRGQREDERSSGLERFRQYFENGRGQTG